MARGFGSTLGAGSTDKVTTGYTLAGDDKRSYSIWFLRNGTGGGGFGSFWRKGALSVQHDYSYIDTSNQIFFWRRNTTGTQTSGYKTSGVASVESVWRNLVITHDGSQNAPVAPTIYLDGVSQSVSSDVVVNSPGDNTSPYVIGNVSDGTRGWDGPLAWFTVWANTLLTGLEAAALAAKAPPWKIRPSAVKLCVPLFGLQSPEFDQQGIVNGSATVTGTAFQMAPLPDFFDLAA